MTDAPETIWALADRRKHWQENPPQDGQHTWHWTEYTRTDHSQALIAAAYEAAGEYLNMQSSGYPDGVAWAVQDDATAIVGLTPSDAKAALDKLIADAERRGMERAACEMEDKKP
jgi:hypothetical protein